MAHVALTSTFASGKILVYENPGMIVQLFSPRFAKREVL